MSSASGCERAARKSFPVLAFLLALSWNVSAEAATPRHVYAALEQIDGCCGQSKVMIARFRRSGWTIESKPDHIYHGVAGPIAFDTDGTLYAGAGSIQRLTFSIVSLKTGRKYSVPDAGEGSTWITSLAISRANYMTFTYVTSNGSSGPWSTGVATYRLSNSSLVNNTVLYTVRSFPYPAGGVAFDSSGRLYLAINGSIQIFASVTGKQLQSLGSIESDVFGNTPGGLVVTSTGTLYAVDLPSPAKLSVSSFQNETRGMASPLRLLTPVGPIQSGVNCCGSWTPASLPYGFTIYADKLFLPFYSTTKLGGSVTGIYEFSRFETGRSRAVQSLLVSSTPSGTPPVVVEDVALGP